MNKVQLRNCFHCGVPHVPADIAERVRAGESIDIEIIHGTGVAGNVLKWRTGALNIDASRVPRLVNSASGALQGYGGSSSGLYEKGEGRGELREGRWPANVVHSGEPEVIAAFAAFGPVGSNSGKPAAADGTAHRGGAFFGNKATPENREYQKRGGDASRFFYSAKASKADRAGSKHPTVKPISLMEWLATLITPPGGTILDPFAGSGTTGIAATNRGFNVILCEREAEYVADIRNRFALPNARAPVVDLTSIRADIEAARAIAALQARLAVRA